MAKPQEAQYQKKARLNIVLPSGDIYKYKVTAAESHIGSGWQNDILLSDPEVSTAHAVLACKADGYFIVDEGSEGGTFVNGEGITKPRKLADGDVIKLGKSELTFTLKHDDKAHKHRPAKAASAEIAVEPAVPAKDNVSEEEKKKKHKKHEHDKHNTKANEQAGAKADDEGSEKKKKHKKHEHDNHKAKADEQADAVAEAEESSNNVGVEVEKKKKKDKKQEKDKVDERVKAARVRAWGGIIATVLSVVLTVTISIIVARLGGNQQSAPVVYGDAKSPKKLAGLSESRHISGGKYEASGVAAVPNANGVLFVDDSKPDQVFYMPVNQLGEQDGPVKAIPLGVSVQNPEGITQLGEIFVIVGSLSTPESNEQGGMAAFDFDPATQTVSRPVVLTGLRKFLFDNVPELKSWADKASTAGGLNIEGIAVDPDPQHPRVLLGLRGPVLNGNALIVPLKKRDRFARFTIDNLEMAEPNAIQLNLNGQAIRDMEYDPYMRAFLIISGAPEIEEKTDFTLWTWNGDGNQAQEEARPKQQTLLNKKMRPEGVTHLKIANQQFVFIVGDANYYAKVDYLSP